jgi:hypothetical protein
MFFYVANLCGYYTMILKVCTVGRERESSGASGLGFIGQAALH